MTTNDPRNPTVKLICAGELLDPAIVEPKRMSFGKISRQTATKKMTATITKGDGGAISPRITNLEKLDGIDAKLTEVLKGEKYSLDVTLVPPFSGKRVTKTLEIDSGVADAPVIRVTAFASMQPRVAAKPYRLQLPVAPEKDWQGRVQLVWDSKPLPNIKDVSINEPGMSVRAETKNDEQWIVLSLNDEFAPILTPRLVTVTTDDKENPSIRIPIIAKRTAGTRGARGKKINDTIRKN